LTLAQARQEQKCRYLATRWRHPNVTSGVNWAAPPDNIKYSGPLADTITCILEAAMNKTWMCLICGWLYDEAAGAPAHGIAPGTSWSDVPASWVCPKCGAIKQDFEMVQV